LYPGLSNKVRGKGEFVHLLISMKNRRIFKILINNMFSKKYGGKERKNLKIIYMLSYYDFMLVSNKINSQKATRLSLVQHS